MTISIQTDVVLKDTIVVMIKKNAKETIQRVHVCNIEQLMDIAILENVLCHVKMVTYVLIKTYV